MHLHAPVRLRSLVLRRGCSGILLCGVRIQLLVLLGTCEIISVFSYIPRGTDKHTFDMYKHSLISLLHVSASLRRHQDLLCTKI
jgi:hypothetical protein